METATSFIMCSVLGKPSDGHILMDSDRPSGLVTLSFSQPISDFGAYWGSGLGCSFGDSPSVLIFYDENGAVIGSDSFFYSGNGKLEWRGYHFDIPVKTITRSAEDGEEGFAMDGVQATVSPVTGQLGKLANISTRGFVESGDNILIGGLIITGNSSKEVLLRARGPSLGLSPSNVPNVLADPVLELHLPDGTVVVNDNWLEAANASSIPPGLQPTSAEESAIFISLDPGTYTAIIRGAGDTTGNALVEVYDLSPESDSQIANISTRGKVETGDDVMIGGFIIAGDQPARVIVRAIGPSLGSRGVTGALADPTLNLYDGNGTQFASNDDWQSDQVQEISASTLAPADPRESAIFRTLPPGNYTAIVRGKNESVGVALIEVYNLQTN